MNFSNVIKQLQINTGIMEVIKLVHKLLSKEKSVNFKKETGHRYKIRNQNGLNNALYDFYSATDYKNRAGYSKKEIRDCLQNHPKKYPCRITIHGQMFECRRIFIEIESCNWFDYSKMKRILIRLLTTQKTTKTGNINENRSKGGA